MADQWTEISDSKALREGDEIRLHFKVSGITYLTAAQIMLMERKLEREPRFTVIRHSIPESSGPLQVTEMTMDVRINKQPYGATGSWLRSGLVVTAGTITAAFIIKAVLVAFGGIIILLTITKVEQLLPSVEGVKAAGLTSLQIGAALVVVYLVFKYA